MTVPAPVRRPTVEDVLDRAVDVIHERGWCQNSLTDDAGRVCLEGAIEHAARDLVQPLEAAVRAEQGTLAGLDRFARNLRYYALERVRRTLVDEFNWHPTLGAYKWNDLVASSADEVIHLLKRAHDAPPLKGTGL